MARAYSNMLVFLRLGRAFRPVVDDVARALPEDVRARETSWPLRRRLAAVVPASNMITGVGVRAGEQLVDRSLALLAAGRRQDARALATAYGRTGRARRGRLTFCSGSSATPPARGDAAADDGVVTPSDLSSSDGR